MFFYITYHSQEVDLENLAERTKKELKKNPFKISGGISANTVFYHSNVNSSRNPLTYFLNGNINIGFYKWSMPISYHLTNQGSQLDYQVPFKFNRLSLSPKYKWIKAYIGDASMSFSPYTYNGLLFTGGGLELSPKIPLKISIMAGRLNKAVERDDTNPQTIPAYKRIGYGAQLKWEKEKYKLGIIGFYAKDIIHSIKKTLDDKAIYPQKNLVLSLQGNVKLRKNIELFAEYANSTMIHDSRNSDGHLKKGIASLFMRTNASSENNSAYNFGANFNIDKISLGLKYERIDPEYKTLGAYYFNNDFENITLNSSFTLFKDKIAIQTNIGRQRDNLNHTKVKQTNRWVGALNMNLKASEKMFITASYSNFSVYTNRQLNQFTNINQNPLLIQQPKDSIDYKQISQNINVNLNYTLPSSKEKQQNININYSLNDMVNRENGIVRKGGISRFHNANINYSISYPERKFNIGTSLSYTHSYTASESMSIIGPSINLTKSFLNDKIQANSAIAYNLSKSPGTKTQVLNLSLGANCTPWKNHNISFNFIQMMRKTSQKIPNPRLSETTCTIGYNYHF